jgi:hypothetical protein
MTMRGPAKLLPHYIRTSVVYGMHLTTNILHKDIIHIIISKVIFLLLEPLDAKNSSPACFRASAPGATRLI